MTDQRLQQLLIEAASDVPPPDLAASAWRRARTRRRRTAALAVAAAGSVAVLATALATGSGPHGAGPPPATRQPSSSAPAAPSATRWHGFAVWLGPAKADEAGLPQHRSPLPAAVDLSAASTPQAAAPLDRAVLAALRFGPDPARAGLLRPTGVVLLGPGGELRTVDDIDLSPQRPVDPYYALQAGSLSPDGSRLALAYAGNVVVRALGTGHDTSYPVADHVTELLGWVGEDRVGLADGSVLHLRDGSMTDGPAAALDRTGIEGFQPWGPVRPVLGQRAQAAFADQLDVVDAGVSNPEVVVADGAVRAILAMPYGDGGTIRYKGCCAVAGWLDTHTVALESRGTDFTVLAWDIRTGQVERVTRLTDTGTAAATTAAVTYADLSRFAAGGP